MAMAIKPGKFTTARESQFIFAYITWLPSCKHTESTLLGFQDEDTYRMQLHSRYGQAHAYLTLETLQNV